MRLDYVSMWIHQLIHKLRETRLCEHVNTSTHTQVTWDSTMWACEYIKSYTRVTRLNSASILIKKGGGKIAQRSMSFRRLFPVCLNTLCFIKVHPGTPETATVDGKCPNYRIIRVNLTNNDERSGGSTEECTSDLITKKFSAVSTSKTSFQIATEGTVKQPSFKRFLSSSNFRQTSNK